MNKFYKLESVLFVVAKTAQQKVITIIKKILTSAENVIN